MSVVISKIANPRGTADILPNQISAWTFLEATSRSLFGVYGYKEIRTPVFEESGLFKRSLGETTEVVNKQLLEVSSSRSSVNSHNAPNMIEPGVVEDAGLALRPEGTAAVVRAYNQFDIGRNEYLSKLFYIGPMFRGERPQKGRLRQFHQIGAEVIGRGANNPLLDAEIIALAVNLLKSFGVEGFKVRINSLGTAEDKAGFAIWLREALKDKIAGLSHDCQVQYERNVFRLLDSKDAACRSVIASLNIGTRHLSESGLKYFESVKAGLDQLGVVYEVSPELVRGLDYYTHTVFEMIFAGLGAQDAIGAGGRYNGLIEQLGGRQPDGQKTEGATAYTGAIGFALGMERILLALEHLKKPLVGTPELEAFVITGSAEFEARAFQLVNALRAAGISADMDFGSRAFKKQFEQANKLGARYALILGDEEIRNGQVAVKNMQSGEQRTVPLDQVVGQWENEKKVIINQR
ncbi:MAG: histidine--tRNA ligase [Candidatus Omnitrophica bacterium]|nr:histidine--tRNA ligase [Candidatus Omnitrophota bacterium]